MTIDDRVFKPRLANNRLYRSVIAIHNNTASRINYTLSIYIFFVCVYVIRNVDID